MPAHTHMWIHTHTQTTKYYAVIQIMVQKCKDDGVNTKVHGIKVIGWVER